MMVLVRYLHVSIQICEYLRCHDFSTVHYALAFFDHAQSSVYGEIFLLAEFFVRYRVDYDIGHENGAEHMGDIIVESLGCGRSGHSGVVYRIYVLEGFRRR